MTNEKIRRIAMEQSARDSGCDAGDFAKGAPVVVFSKEHPEARRYLSLPFYCDLTSYGSNIVASIHPELAGFMNTFLSRHKPQDCFETPVLYLLNQELEKHNMQVCFMAEYFLPDVNMLKDIPCSYSTKLLTQPDFAALYTPEWSNALCEKRRELDVLGVGAYDGGRLIGLAACSADCDSMWQIGIDVLPEYRRQGIASALTSCLAQEILARGKVPFYCAAWSNLRSVGNAIKSGFRPAWVEITAKSREFIAEMLKPQG